MPRYFAPISPGDFQKKVESTFFHEDEGFLFNLLREKLESDVKVAFDFENFTCRKGSFGPQQLMGFVTFPNGLTIFGMCAGGDWEHPVYFLLYWDGKKIRAYIPTEGNPWNTDTKQAYGNNDVADLKNAKKRWPGVFNNTTEIDAGDFEFDGVAIQDDILLRIQPQPSKEKDPPKQKKTQTIQERIETLVFYGCGDEAFELFQSTCSLCYQMYGLGQTKQAEVLCGWAEEQATASMKDWQENGGDLTDQSDTKKGHWGY